MLYIEKLYIEDSPEREGQYWNDIPVIKAVTKSADIQYINRNLLLSVCQR